MAPEDVNAAEVEAVLAGFNDASTLVILSTSVCKTGKTAQKLPPFRENSSFTTKNNQKVLL